MSLAEILEGLPKLTPEERRQVYLCLQALEDEPDVEATPEMLEAINEAIRASEQGRIPRGDLRPLEDRRRAADALLAPAQA